MAVRGLEVGPPPGHYQTSGPHHSQQLITLQVERPTRLFMEKIMQFASADTRLVATNRLHKVHHRCSRVSLHALLVRPDTRPGG